MHRLIYLSSASQFLNKEELNSLLTKSRIKNSINNVTGILIYIDGDIIQVLEGEKEVIHNLFNIIKLDERHRTIINVFDDAVETTMFENWSMGYSSDTILELRKKEPFNNFEFKDLKENKNNFVTIFLDSFIKTHRIY